MKIIGLTGSIATGKSFVATQFRKKNIKIFSSDTEVSNLLLDINVINSIKESDELGCVIKNDVVDKKLLSNIAFKDIKILKKLEDILHPLVNDKTINFIKEFKNEKIILLEIPLLFEKKYQKFCNKIITTYCSDKTQKERALRRSNIDIDRLNFIIKQQMHGNLKAKITDYLVYTDISYQYTFNQIDQIFLKEGVK